MGQSGNLTGPGVQFRRLGQVLGEEAALWFRSGSRQRKTNTLRAPARPRRRPGAMKVRVQVTPRPRRSLALGAAGNPQPQVPGGVLFAARSKRNSSFWGVGKGGRPRPLGTLGKDVSLGS